MEIEKFIEYKKLIESDGLIINDEAAKIHAWMEETGRIDEGFLGRIWKWLKRNFSPIARKLYRLADEFEQELLAELRAEWGNIEGKSLVDKFRRGSWMKLSNDIEDRMEIIAKDDTDYRELVRILINKKKLKVRKQLISELGGQIDPESKRRFLREIDDDLTELSKEEKEHLKKQALKKVSPKEYEKLTTDLKSNIKSNSKFRRFFAPDEISDFVSMIVLYVINLSDVDSKIPVKNETSIKISQKYLNAFEEIIDRIKSDKISEEDIAKIVKKMFQRLLRTKPAISFDKIKTEAGKLSQKKVKELEEGQEDDSDEDEDVKISDEELEDNNVVTPNTEEVSDVNVEDTVKDAAEKTGEKKPTTEDVVEEIESTIKKFFENSFTSIFSKLQDEVKSFNALSKEEKLDINHYEYNLDKDGNLQMPTEDNVRTLFKDFVKIAGKIVPYYEIESKSAKMASITVAGCIFQIYAYKKDVDGKMSEKTIEKIVNAIKEEYKLGK